MKMLPLELVSSKNHHKPHNIKPSFNNFSIKRNTFIIRNQNKHKSSLNLVAKFRKLQCKLTSVAGRYNSRTLQVGRFFKHSSGKRIYKQTINFLLTSILLKKTGLKCNNLMLLNQCIESMSINVRKHNPFQL